MALQPLQVDFVSRETIIDYVAHISPWLKEERDVSPIAGGEKAAYHKLGNIDPLHYGKTRNYLNGNVTGLSPYIRHGILSLNEVKENALRYASTPEQIRPFLQELCWRDFWQRLYRQHPDWIWQDIEPYKTGWNTTDYADELPKDIATGNTGVACLDAFIHMLLKTGYMHNHTRMYVASYIIHWRRVKWQAGARWMLHHLLDGDPASNNFSWQWIASTFSQKPYIFNLENVQKYATDDIDTSVKNNYVLAESYETLALRLFPKLTRSG